MSFFEDIGDLFGGGNGEKAAQDAQAAYSEQIQKAIAEYQESLKQGRADIGQGYTRAIGFEQPYLSAGQAGLQSYLGTLGIGDRQGAINRFKASHGYQFALQQGLDAQQKGMAARGLTGSGAEQKALTQYGQGLAGQEYGKYQSQLAGLASMGAQMGQTAGGQAMRTGQELGGLGEDYARMIGGAYSGLGSSAANAIMAGYGSDAAQRAAMWGALGKLGGSALAMFGGGASGFGGAGGGYSPWLNPDTNQFQ